MKALILCGGLGTRYNLDNSTKILKPLLKVDGISILERIINLYIKQGVDEFILLGGFKYNKLKKFSKKFKNLKIKTINTGLNTQTGGRISEVMKILPQEKVIATYGDGLANVSIKKLLDFHTAHGRLATVTAVRPPARFGYMKIENNAVTHFGEKNQADEGWINGGFFVLEPKVTNYVESINEPFESGALVRLANKSQLMAYHHEGFWQPMDTLREKRDLEKLAYLSVPPWLDN